MPVKVERLVWRSWIFNSSGDVYLGTISQIGLLGCENGTGNGNGNVVGLRYPSVCSLQRAKQAAITTSTSTSTSSDPLFA